MFHARNWAMILLTGALWAGMTNPALAELQTIAYPDAENASFFIEAPEDWEMTPGEEEGDYFDLEGPTGVVLSFRTIKASSGKKAEKALNKAIEESIEFIKENYKNVDLSEAKDDTLAGCEGFFSTGSGVDRETGEDALFGLGWYLLSENEIAEIWFVVNEDDKKGAKQAEKILRSFSIPE